MIKLIIVTMEEKYNSIKDNMLITDYNTKELK